MVEGFHGKPKADDEKLPNPSRRKFITGVGAAGFLSGLGISGEVRAEEQNAPLDEVVPDNLPQIAEREKIIDSLVQLYESQDTKRILESGTDEEIISLLQIWPEWLTRADTDFFRGTKHDHSRYVEAHGYPSFQIQANDLEDIVQGVPENRLNNPDSEKIPYGVASANAFTLTSGSDTVVVTNNHVIKAMHVPSIALAIPAEFDVAIADIPLSSKGLSQPLPLEKSRDITGSLVFNYVVKNDNLSPAGVRVRAGIAIKMTPHLFKFIQLHSAGNAKVPIDGMSADDMRIFEARALASYIVITAFEEEMMLSDWNIEAGHFYRQYFSFAQGSSGSAWTIARPDLTLNAVGVHWGGGLLSHGVFGEQLLGISYFDGPDVLNSVMEIYRNTKRN